MTRRWDPHHVFAWSRVLHQVGGRSFLSSPWRFQRSKHTSHLPPPFMTYNHGENNVNLWYERYTDSGDGRTSDKVKSHITLEASSSSSFGTSPPCFGSDRRSVLVPFQFLRGHACFLVKNGHGGHRERSSRHECVVPGCLRGGGGLEHRYWQRI